jgi:hypothetical protein
VKDRFEFQAASGPFIHTRGGTKSVGHLFSKMAAWENKLGFFASNSKGTRYGKEYDLRLVR